MSQEETGANRPERLMSGGRAIAEMLKCYEVGPMFGMGGFQLLPFYDSISKVGLNHNLINDERCGIFAADAYARITGRPGVCDATLGPGATNLVTGLAESLNAGVPLVVFTGNTNRAHSWKNMTQEARQLEILAPACKEVIRIEDISRIPELVRRAFWVATSGRPGPVVVDVPEDVAHGEYEFAPEDIYAEEKAKASPALRCRPDRDDLMEADTLLRQAKRPLVLAGGGVHLAGAQAVLSDFAKVYNIPVAHTLSGKGAIACNSPLSVGLFGRYSRIANELIETSDCLLVVGCKLGEIATKRYSLPPKGVPVIHMDVMAEEITRTINPTVSLWADCLSGLEELAAALSGDASEQFAMRKDYVREVAERMETWREEVADKLTSDEQPISMARLCHELNRTLPANAVVVADGGFAAHWTGLLYDTKEAGRRYIANRGFASIGYGLPGSMGAQLAEPDDPVVGITGDGGFNMVIGELETARRMGIGLTLIIVNNAASGYVKALQHALFGGQYQSSDLNELNYANLAREFGCEGIRVEDPNDLAAALEAGMANRDQPTVIDVVVTRDASKMLPGVDNRTAPVKKGDRIA